MTTIDVLLKDQLPEPPTSAMTYSVVAKTSFRIVTHISNCLKPEYSFQKQNLKCLKQVNLLIVVSVSLSHNDGRFYQRFMQII